MAESSAALLSLASVCLLCWPEAFSFSLVQTLKASRYTTHQQIKCSLGTSFLARDIIPKADTGYMQRRNESLIVFPRRLADMRLPFFFFQVRRSIWPAWKILQETWPLYFRESARLLILTLKNLPDNKIKGAIRWTLWFGVIAVPYQI